MLSEDIQDLANALMGCARGDVVVESIDLAAIGAMLEDYSSQARNLEEQAQRGLDLSDDMLRLAALLARHGATVCMPKGGQGCTKHQGR